MEIIIEIDTIRKEVRVRENGMEWTRKATESELKAARLEKVYEMGI